MGAGASTFPDKIDKATAEQLAGKRFCEAKFNALASADGLISREAFLNAQPREDLIFSLTACDKQAVDTVNGACPGQPLAVPDEGVHAWELQGQRLSSLGIALPEQHTVALWVKLLPSRDREPGALITGADCTPWLSLAEDKLQGSPLPLDGTVLALTVHWQLIVLRGSTTTETSTLCAWSGDAVPTPFGKVITLGNGAILDSVGDVKASLGSVESLTVWSRQLSASELRNLWVCGCARLGLPKPAPWIDLAAPPPCDTLRIVGAVVETVGGLPLEGVHISASLAGQPVSAATPTTSTAEDGTFIFEIPASSDTADVATGAIPMLTVVVTLAQAGFAPQTVVGVAAGGEELRMPKARLTRLGMQQTIEAAEGGVLTDASSRTVFSVPPSAFLNADGSVFAGKVTISTATIDPSDEEALASMPGDFSAVSIDGDEGVLRSFGAYYFSATDKKGAELGLNPQASVSVEWPLSVPLDTADKGVAPPCAWSFDASTGKWMQHGGAALEADGVRLPAPGTAEYIALGKPAVELSVADEVGLKKAKKAKGKKGKGGESGAIGTAQIADAVRKILEGRATVQSLRHLHVSFNGWCNIDSMLNSPGELPCLIRGRLANWAAASKAWCSQQIVAVGTGYASRTCARVQADGAFELAVQPNSTVKLQLEMTMSTGEEMKHKNVRELPGVATGKALSAMELGELDFV